MLGIVYSKILKDKLTRHLSMLSTTMWLEEINLASEIMQVLDLLSDGKWHQTGDLLLKLGFDDYDFHEITAFLDKYGFIKVDAKNGRIKINNDFRKLLVQTVV